MSSFTDTGAPAKNCATDSPPQTRVQPKVTDLFHQDVNHNKDTPAAHGEEERERGAGGAAGWFSTALSGRDTFFSRLQLSNTGERKQYLSESATSHTALPSICGDAPGWWFKDRTQMNSIRMLFLQNMWKSGVRWRLHNVT